MEFEGHIDTKEVEKAIEGTTLNLTRIIQRMSAAVNKEVIKAAKRNYSSMFNSANHNFRYPDKSILKGFKQGEQRGNYNRALVKAGGVNVDSYVMNKVFYALFLEHGADIQPRDPEKYLEFKINGEFKKVKSVHLPASEFTLKALNEYWNTNKYQPIAEKQLQIELAKYWGKQ